MASSKSESRTRGSTRSSYPWYVVSIEAPFCSLSEFAHFNSIFHFPHSLLALVSGECRHPRRRHSLGLAPFPPHVRSALGLRLRIHDVVDSRACCGPFNMMDASPHGHTMRLNMLLVPCFRTRGCSRTQPRAHPLICLPSLPLSTFLTIPNIPLERVHNFKSYPHPPVKVVKWTRELDLDRCFF